eukprot:SAG31_NODE_3330_length_4398_cov_5.734589_2_plen_91_part_00
MPHIAEHAEQVVSVHCDFLSGQHVGQNAVSFPFELRRATTSKHMNVYPSASQNSNLRLDCMATGSTTEGCARNKLDYTAFLCPALDTGKQ